MAVILEGGPQRWCCPACDVTDVTRGLAANQVRMHTCSNGLTAPLVREGVAAKVERHEREDYVAGETVQYDQDGRPVMNSTITTDEGEHVTVYCPTATLNAEARY